MSLPDTNGTMLENRSHALLYHGNLIEQAYGGVMTQSPASDSGDQPPAGPGLTAEDLTARLETAGDLTAAEIAALARLDDGPDAAGGCCDGDTGCDHAGCDGTGCDHAGCDGTGCDGTGCDGEPPAEWLALPDDEHAALLAGGTGGPAVAEVLEAGFIHHLPSPGATGFAAGGPLGRVPGGHELAWHAGAARQRGLDAVSDAELCGLMEAGQRLESWGAGLKLATVTELDARRARPDGREGEYVSEEVGAVLRLTGRAASSLVELSRQLERLPATAAMLAAGLIDPRRAAIIADHTAVLSSQHAVAVQDAVLPAAPAMTTGELAAACRHAVAACDPAAAIRRRKQAEKDARVETWAEAAGTAALAGRDLAPASVIAADKNLDADARWLKAHGRQGGHDQLRADAMIARLTGQSLDTLLPSAASSTSVPGVPGVPGAGGSVNLTMPAAAWLSRSDAPGEVPGFGPADAGTCRDLADALAASPATRWCVTVTDRQGRAVAHGCARTGPGPPGNGNPAAWLATVKITPIETGSCEHRRESAGYQPSDSLRHLLKIRSRRCGFPGCRRPAVRCDDDHTIPYDKGGRTCECNLHPLCRRHHQTKQEPGWHLDQPHPGELIWTLPSGRTCTPTTEPYPV
jgi:Domain of unknown function (DUF222)